MGGSVNTLNAQIMNFIRFWNKNFNINVYRYNHSVLYPMTPILNYANQILPFSATNPNLFIY